MPESFHSDFYADTFDTVDGMHVLFNRKNPTKHYEVVSLMDHLGEETEDPEEAAGGVVKLADECFTTFMWS